MYKMTFERESDGKLFESTFVGHWTDIESVDGEKDSVKLYGFGNGYDLFVSANKGHGYKLIARG